MQDVHAYIADVAWRQWNSVVVKREHRQCSRAGLANAWPWSAKRERRARELPHPACFLRLIRLPDVATREQLEFPLLAKSGSNHVAGFTHHGQEEPNLLVDGRRRSRILETRALVGQDSTRIDFVQKFVSERLTTLPIAYSAKVIPQMQSVIRQIFVPYIPQPADAILSFLRKVVIASLELTPPLVLGVPGHCLRS